MATKRNAKAADKPTARDDDGLDLMRKRYNLAADYWWPKFDKCRDDIKFVTVPGEQWDSKLRARRGNRPLYEFPKLEAHTRQVINEMRQSRPQGKVRGIDETDRGLAEIMQGICRNIESVSNADQAYDIAFEPAVQGGFGVWRLCTDYANDDDFDQDIFIDPVRNPFSVLFDPAANEIDRRDGLFAFIEELMPEDTFKVEHPKADIAAVLGESRFERWRDRGQVKVCEYWYKERVKRQLWAVQKAATPLETTAPPPQIVFADELGLDREELAANGYTLIREREVVTHKVFSRLTNGAEWLTEPHEFPSKFIPLIPVFGNLQLIDGEDFFKGMVRSAKDQQRLHNVHRTAAVEAVAKAPKAPFIAKPSWVAGFESMWKNANAEDYAILFLNDDAPEGVIPQRAAQAEVPVALLQLAALDNDDIKAGTGQYAPSLGAQSNETSGRAISARQRQGATATYNYVDNLVYAIRFQYEILVDMIPRVYDTQRVMRLLGEDGGAKWKTLYQEVTDADGKVHTVNDISKGKYDTTVTVGPSYATQRMEAADAFATLVGQIGSAIPQAAPILAFAAISNLDFPGADEATGALRKVLVGMGAMEPKDGEAPPAPQQPDPMMLAQLRKILAAAAKDEATAAKTNAEAATVVPTAQADVGKTEAQTVDQQLKNLLAGGQMEAFARFLAMPPTPDFVEVEPALPNMQFESAAA